MALNDRYFTGKQLLIVMLFSGPSPVGLATIFYCPRFETSLFVSSSGGSESESYVTTDGQPASLSCNKPSREQLVLIFCYCVVLNCFHGYLIIESLRSSECFLAMSAIIMPELRCHWNT
jgi:hypothetical protein